MTLLNYFKNLSLFPFKNYLNYHHFRSKNLNFKNFPIYILYLNKKYILYIVNKIKK